ncbi:hypothetical protein C8K36_10425 [Rhodococcus sp. OK519]|uniref:hypothetical protein n=1 Tax=Rhodococcus sp. OK519 TaxID=2135729 RepID=UPI000D34C8F2|nr:hypothetical protein C8K36_10425 [Rhodococcus sp. OK519]
MSSRSLTRRILSGSAVLCATLAAVTAPAPASAAPEPAPCAWRFLSDGEVLNVAFPDTNAAYWVLPYALGPSDTIELSGTFPSARYFSLNTYGTDLDTIDTLRDDEIAPDAGSSNPFDVQVARSAPPQARQWHATLVAGAADPTRNQIQALRPGAAPVGFLIVRVYVPDDPASLSGGVPLPDVRYRIGGATVPVQPCGQPFDPSGYTGPVADAARTGFDRAIESAASGAFPGNAPEATFVNPASTSGLFPNGDNKYIGAQFTHQPGRVVVVRGRAPTFPDTRGGTAVTEPGRQVRYWSMCQNDLISPYPVVACAADFQTTLDADGFYNYVVAPPEDLPSVLEPGVTVVPWGSTDVPTKLLFLRNMLPDDTFYPQSIQASQADDADPATSMGAYYPTAAYCATSVLAADGYLACFEGDDS